METDVLQVLWAVGRPERTVCVGAGGLSSDGESARAQT